MIQQIDKCENCYSCCKSFGDIGGPDAQEKIELYDITYKYSRCSMLCEDNRCSIYSDRPISCKEFECVYIKSDLSNEWIPEKVGFVTFLLRDMKTVLVVPNESKYLDIDYWKRTNSDKIDFMKKTAELLTGKTLSLQLDYYRDEDIV